MGPPSRYLEECSASRRACSLRDRQRSRDDFCTLTGCITVMHIAKSNAVSTVIEHILNATLGHSEISTKWL
jgi:hypothetical protein